MWIITHDNVHEAGVNPAVTVPKSKDFLSKMTRKKAEARRHVFRLTKGGRVLFRGVAYFDDEASFKEILRPLDEFGRNLYDCDAIAYQVGRDWRDVPEALGREFDELVRSRQIDVRDRFLGTNELDATYQATAAMLKNFINYAYTV